MSYEKEFERKATTLAGKFVQSPIKMIFVSFILLGVIGFGLSMIGGIFGTASSVVSAPGRVIQKTLETDNIIQSYEWFYDVNAGYNARLSQVNQFKSLFESETDPAEKSRLRIDMAAIQQTCRDLTEKYNANSEKMNKSIFKGWSLPESLNQQTCN